LNTYSLSLKRGNQRCQIKIRLDLKKGPKTGRQKGKCEGAKPIAFGRMSKKCGRGLKRGLGRNFVNK